MTGLNSINTSLYRMLRADSQLTEICGIYKGIRPKRVRNPSITVVASRLEPGEGEGVRMCDITVRAHMDAASDSTADNILAEQITCLIHDILSDSEIELEGARAMPLIEGGVTGPEWSDEREGELVYECTFGLVFVSGG